MRYEILVALDKTLCDSQFIPNDAPKRIKKGVVTLIRWSVPMIAKKMVARVRKIKARHF